MDGGNPITFSPKVPVDDEGLRANVRHAMSLRLPTLRDFEYRRQGHLDVVANGPSAPAYFQPTPKNGPVLALNGALELFNGRRIIPDYWAACDPQELVTDRFLRCAPYDVTYLIASKCHPSVFERMSDRNVILWHVGEPATRALFDHHDIVIPASSSITSTSFELMTHLGFRRFETWGWDGCYMDGQGHAVPQPEAPSRVEITVHDRVYETSPVWALECDDIANRLVGFPFPIHIHGDGFFADMLSRVVPHRVTRD